MSIKITAVQPLTAIRKLPARLALGAGLGFALLLALLHVLRPDLDPSWRFISEYAVGSFGYLMIIAFLSFSAGYVGLFLAIRSQVPTNWGKVGLALLGVSAVGMAMAGVFVTDPLTTPATERSMTGRLHEVGAFLDLTPFAAPVISWSVARHNPNWLSARRSLLSTAWLPLLGLVIFIGATAISGPEGPGPDAALGWPNRFLVITYCIWLVTFSWQALRLRRQAALDRRPTGEPGSSTQNRQQADVQMVR
jgi:Protein of unknown function (DUF998)